MVSITFFNKLFFKESECIDPKSICSLEIKRRFAKHVQNLDDFNISSKKLNMMNVIISPDDNKNIAHYNYIN